MKYNLLVELRDHEDNVVKEVIKGAETVVTVKLAFLRALLADGQHSVEEKMNRFELFLKLKAQELVDLGAEEVSLLHKAVEIYSTMFMGRLKHYLDQKEG
jgi:hypothetical protein